MSKSTPPASIRLETERLVLRLPRPDDAPAVSEYLGDPEVMRFLGGATVPPDDAPDVVRKWLERWRQNELGPFVLERRGDGRVLGRVGFVVWDTRTWQATTRAEAGRHAQPELGWVLARAHWGKGYATEAALAARDWARRERRVQRLISLIAPGNTASQRVAQRLGAWPTERVTLGDSGEAVVWEHPESERPRPFGARKPSEEVSFGGKRAPRTTSRAAGHPGTGPASF